MKKNVLLIGLLTLGLVFSLRLSAQNVSYKYDNAGNRISREIPLVRSSTQEEIIPEPFLDVIEKQEVKIYPNPTEGVIMVELPNFTDKIEGKIWIGDVSGKTVKHQNTISRQNTFDLGSQANGIYLLKITVNGETITYKIIKK